MVILPKDVFMQQQIVLQESHYDCNGCVKLNCLMEFMQNLATEHAETINVGWNAMNSRNLVWVLTKVKFVLRKPIDRSVGYFTLYTWPIEPGRFFSERRFVAVKDGEELMSATTFWMVIDKTERKALSCKVLDAMGVEKYDSAPVSVDATFARIRPDESFQHVYTQHVRRSQLDRNGHVNNTNYVTYAVDVLDKSVPVCGAEIVYQKECMFGDTLDVVAKYGEEDTQVCGILPNGECCFTVRLLHK